MRHPTGNNLPTLLAYLSRILVQLLCCNDSYIVHYAPVLYSPIMPDSLLCPKVAAPPRYFVYFPLGFTNESNFKSALLTRNHVSLV
uniref:Uncharacterized protein n=1 Tax=Candidatus Kentrum sp. FM TaxID=2126340 RepID=A0A450S973_9GAMM|nr:MAG: hypothetical protein BECKFM1743C_GA0114222_100605 [Candidatus Kentron sp. FM]